MKSSAEIRQAFLTFFAERGHQVVASAPLIPQQDATLLFNNAGMVPFKDVFLGREHRDYRRAVSAQTCIRAGGKHNDLENVGYTARHHTFFEMLGNFSFGDYFKREAIQFAWDFLTKTLKLPPEKLWITVFHEDQEAADIWLKEMGVSPERFSRCGEADNFWSMGDTGPCGPCSEIFYDHGSEVAGGPPGSAEADGDRYVEIWNLVFMQFDRAPDGQLTPLPNPCVDTGMGLERIAAVMQGVHNNYDIDIFQTLRQAIRQQQPDRPLSMHSQCVIADHIRSASFLIAEGCFPSNEAQGYVLRRIIRRAIRHGHQGGLSGAFFHQLVPALCQAMGGAYPRLQEQQTAIMEALHAEEQQFAKTLSQGLKLLEQQLAHLQSTEIPGAVVFQLYDTYGFPVDLTADIAREHGLVLDLAGFEACMAQQRTQSRAASRFGGDYQHRLAVEHRTQFQGYDTLATHTTLVAAMVAARPQTQLSAGTQAELVLAETPFYAEGGGQVGDQGWIQQQAAIFEVTNTVKVGDVFWHHGRVVSGTFVVDAPVEAHVDATKRAATARHHSATHLLHAALRQQLGSTVVQKGSLVDAQRLRFDFTHARALSVEEIEAIEALVMTHICANHPVDTELMACDAALASGAMALFGEKYAQEVRVLSMGDFSKELCGGTHVRRTGDIGAFVITSESSVASGVRRIEALAGPEALRWQQQQRDQLREVAGQLKTSADQVPEKLAQLLVQHREQDKRLQHYQTQLSGYLRDSLRQQQQQIGTVSLIAAAVEGIDAKSLRTLMDQLKQSLTLGVVVLALIEGEKVQLIVGVTPNLTDRLSAGNLVNFLAKPLGGKGGGRADMAQAGGSGAAQVPAVLATVAPWIEENMSGDAANSQRGE